MTGSPGAVWPRAFFPFRGFWFWGAALAWAPLAQAQRATLQPATAMRHVDTRLEPGGVLPAGRSAAALTRRQSLLQATARGAAELQALVPGASVKLSETTGAPELVSAPGMLTAAAPGEAAFDIVKRWYQANAALYGLSAADLANLHFIGESVSPESGLRMVRVEQMVNGMPVFQSETRVTLDRDGRIVRTVGQMVPGATETADPVATTVSHEAAFVKAMGTVGIQLAPAALSSTAAGARKFQTVSSDKRIRDQVGSELIYFPVAPGVLVPAWLQTAVTTTEQDWMTIVDANSGSLLWRKATRAHSSTQQARFSVYVQADGTTPADSPAPFSPTTAVTGGGTQAAAITRTNVNMLTAQSATASPNGWIDDNGTSTVGNNVDAHLDRDNNNVADPGTLDNNGRPVGNLDSSSRQRDFLGTNYDYTPPPALGNPQNGTAPTDAQEQRGAVTQLFYLANWYHDRLYALGFDPAAGNFQTNNFGLGGLGNDAVQADTQDSAGISGGDRNNANFSTFADGTPGRMQMYVFDGPTTDRDGSLDAEIVLHELTHGLSNRLIGNGSGLNWDIGGGMGEGWSDFYALSLLNNTNTDNPNGKYASGAYATYQLGGLTDNYVYGIRRFPYSTDNTVNPMTWADVDDVTYDLSGGIPTSPLNFSFAGADEVHNIGEVWCNTLWEVRSRVIADPAGANGNVPTGNQKMLRIVTDALKMTPIDPSFIDARDAILAADAATNGAANEASIWAGFADRGLGYKAVAPYSRLLGHISGHVAVGESFDVPYLDVQSVAIDDSTGNGNGAIDPNEPVKITVKLRNPYVRAASGVASATATLSSSSGVTITNSSSTYGAIAAQGSADGTPFAFTVPANATAGQALRFTITVNSALGTKAVNFTMRVGTRNGNGAPITYTRTISGGLAIPDNTPRGVVDTLAISDDYEIADLNFRIDSLTHGFVGDLSIMLRGPTGVGCDLVTYTGLEAASPSGGYGGVNFTNTVIDDQASGNLLTAADTAAPYTGSWKPIFNVTTFDTFGLAHDPVGTLSRYNGLSTQGNWKVLVADELAPDSGTLNAWSLIITPVAFTIAPFQNTPPSVTTSSGALAYNENQAATAIDPGLTVTDSDNANLAGGSVSITAGFAAGADTLAFTSQNGIGGSYNATTGVLTLTGSSSVANYQTALRSVTFACSSDNPATSRTITFSASDGGSNGTATRGITITPVNDAPAVTTSSGSSTYLEGTGPATVDSALTVTDVDNVNLAGATVAITQNFVAGTDVLTFTSAGGINGNYDNTTGVLTLAGSVSRATYQTVLRSVGFRTDTDDPSTAARTITFTVNDGAANGSGSRNIGVMGVNDAPTLDAIGNPPGIPMNAGQQTVSLSGIGSGGEAGQTLTVSIVGNTNTALIPSPQVTYTSPNATGSITYTPAAGGSGSAQLTVRVSDNGGTANGGVDFVERSFVVNVGSAAPVLTNTASILAYVENAAAMAIDPGLTVSDPDGTTLAGADISITSNFASGQDVLAFTVASGISGTYSASTGVLHLTGTAAITLYQTVLRSVTYANSSDAPSTAMRTITFTADDGTGNVGSGTREIALTAVNDPPTGANFARTLLEDSSYTFASGDFGFSDAKDGSANSLQAVKITTVPLNGSLQNGGSAVGAGDVISLASIDAGLLTFTPLPNDAGSAYASFTFQVQDDGGTDNGGIDLDATARVATLNVTGVNDAPSGADNTLSVAQGGSLTLTAASFGFSDPLDSPANTLDAVRITTTPGAGTLAVSGTAVVAGAFVSVADINSGLLVFQPGSADPASPFTTFTFQVRDNGGTANGGIDLEANAHTITINVTAGSATGPVAAKAGTYNGLISAPAGVDPEHLRAGLAKLRLTAKGRFTGKITVGGDSKTVHGKIDDTGVATFGKHAGATATLNFKKAGALVLALQLDVAGDSDKLTGVLTKAGAAWAGLDADRALYTAKARIKPPFMHVPPAVLGKYTALFPALTPAEQGISADAYPQGDGYAVLSVSKSGTAKIVGKLADNSTVSYRNALSKTNAWPFYMKLAHGKGSISGTAFFRHQASLGDLDATDLEWFTPAGGKKVYPQGWPTGIQVDLAGGKLQASPLRSLLPGAGLPTFTGNARLEFSAADLDPAGVLDLVNVNMRNGVSVVDSDTGRTALRLHANGLFSGSFIHPVTHRRTILRGAVLQEQKLGSGFFISEKQSGHVKLESAP